MHGNLEKVSLGHFFDSLRAASVDVALFFLLNPVGLLFSIVYEQ